MSESRVALAGSARRIPRGASNIRPANPGEPVSVSLYGVDRANRQRVEAFAAAHGLTAEGFDAGRRFMQLSGNIGAMQHAFGVNVRSFEVGGQTFRAHTEDISVPKELHGISVFGLDNLPAARPRD